MMHAIIFALMMTVSSVLDCVPQSSSPSFSLPSFGTTHFIVGFPTKKPAPAAEQVHPKKTPSASKSASRTAPKKATHSDRVSSFESGNARVLFSPDDNVQQELIALIDSEMHFIRVAIYSFTDREIATALINARKRGVSVEIVTDPSNMYVQYSKIAMLEDAGIVVYAYNPDHKKVNEYTLMHHKFAVFDCCTKAKKALVWTGSFNFTKSAGDKNQENVVILDHGHAVESFTNQFDRLKTRCRNCRHRTMS